MAELSLLHTIPGSAWDCDCREMMNWKSTGLRPASTSRSNQDRSNRYIHIVEGKGVV